MYFLSNLLLIVNLLINYSHGVRILGVFPSPGYSQFILAEKLMGELARRGHEVTIITTFKPDNTIENYETILIEKLNMTGNFFAWKTLNDYVKNIAFLEMCTAYSESILSEKEVQNLIHSNQKFDLVIVENFGNEAHMAFAHHFKTPLVMFSSQGVHDWNSHLIGSVRLPSINPFSVTANTNRMDFFQRFHNTLLSLHDYIYKEMVFLPAQQRLLDKYFPNTMDLKKIITSGEILLTFSNPITTGPALLTNSVVEIGGFHITPRKLPSHIQDLLDRASSGAILISLGSNLNCKDMSKEKLELFLNVIHRLPQSILWKCEIDIYDRPANLFISKWLPQTDILAHPNTIAFVTHNGLLSTTEAIYYAVPMVSLPIFGDQPMNAARAAENGIAITLDYFSINQDQLYNAITEIIKNSVYKDRVKKISKMFLDQPIPPLDLAIHAIESVIKHKPGKFLRSPVLDLCWFQLYSLDVFLIVAMFIVLFCLTCTFVSNKIVIHIRNNKKKCD